MKSGSLFFGAVIPALSRNPVTFIFSFPQISQISAELIENHKKNLQ